MVIHHPPRKVTKVDQAYRMARKYYRKKWTGRAQYHLSAIGEREDVWVISFFLFIPDPLYTRFLTYKECELCHVRGIIPVYYDSNPKWIEIKKDTGDCREVLYRGYDWLFGPGKEYEESLIWSSRERLFSERAGKGKGFYYWRKCNKMDPLYDSPINHFGINPEEICYDCYSLEELRSIERWIEKCVREMHVEEPSRKRKYKWEYDCWIRRIASWTDELKKVRDEVKKRIKVGYGNS